MRVQQAAPDVHSSFKSAFVIAIAIALAAGALLIQDNVIGTVDGRIGDTRQPGDLRSRDAFTQPTPAGATPKPRSSATITVPGGNLAEDGDGRPAFPSLGRYVYNVVGTESATLIGSRPYPAEMTMTVDRERASGLPELRGDELSYQLHYSDQHNEEEVVAFRREGIVFTYESWNITFGSTSQNSEGTYSPSMMQIPVPLEEGAVESGSSQVTASDGAVRRTEEWKVEVIGQERVRALDDYIDTWVVSIERTTRAGSSEPTTRSRTYWLSPERSMWVKFSERVSSASGFALARISYSSQLTATLARVEQL